MKERNIGFDILKIFFAFEVLLVHGWLRYTYPYKPGLEFPWCFFNRTGTVAVPGFIMLSFMLMNFGSITESGKKFWQRISRLLIPHIAWTFIYFVIYSIYKGTDMSYSKLAIQLFTGHGYNEVMWFQIAIVVLTVLFSGVYKISGGKKFDIAVISLGWLSIILQYSRILFVALKDFPGYFNYSYGRSVEILPAAAIGIMMNRFNYCDIIKKNRHIVLPFSLLALFSIYKYDIFVSYNGYAYSGVWRTLAALLIINVVSCFSYQNLFKEVETLIISLAKCTPCVYYVQRMFITILFKTRKEFLECFLLFGGIMLVTMIILHFVKNKWVRSIIT